MSRKFIVEIEENEDGDYIIQIPDEIIEHLGLVEGDILKYDIDGESVIMYKEE